MHCPSCGQEQVSAHTKFCSKCGLPLDLVAELLANGGTIPQLAEIETKRSFLSRKQGVLFSVFWFVLFTLFLTSVAGILGLEYLPGLAAVTGVFGALLILLFSLIFLPSSKVYFGPGRPVNPDSMPVGLFTQPNRTALPPEQSIPVTAYTAPQGNWRAPDTGELVTPGTVTENTTKLLSKEDNR